MCRAGTVFMTSAGCNHARQSGWQDDAVTKSLSGLITRCSSHTSRQTFCGKLTIDSAGSGSSPKRSRRGGQLPPSLASLVLSPDDEAVAGVNTLDGKCKFCTLYESEIRMAEQIKRTLMDYNMALLLDETRFLVEEESKNKTYSVLFHFLTFEEANKTHTHTHTHTFSFSSFLLTVV